MPHDEIRKLLSAFLDGELEIGEEALVRDHLATCDLCRAELEELSRTAGLVAALPDEELPAGFQASLRNRLLQAAAEAVSGIGGSVGIGSGVTEADGGETETDGGETGAGDAQEFVQEPAQETARPDAAGSEKIRSFPAGQKRRWWSPGWAAVAALFILVVGASYVLGPTMWLAGSGAPSRGAASSDSAGAEAGYEMAIRGFDQSAAPAEEAAADGAGAPGAAPATGESGIVAPSGNLTVLAEQAAPVERMIIKTGTMTVDVENLDEAYQGSIAAVEQLNGYAEASNRWEERIGRYAELRLRVPADRFDELTERVADLGHVRRDEVSRTDVTEEYVDVDARLKNFEAQEEQYREILAQAETVEDVLKVQNELSRIRGEIEALTARLQSLERRTALSTLNLSLREPAEPPLSDEPPQNLGEELERTLLGSLRWLVRFGRQTLVGLVWLLPWLASLGILAGAGWWLWRRRRGQAPGA